MRLSQVPRLWRYERAGAAAARYARSHGGLGMAFDTFGRRLGRRLVFRETALAMELIATPVNCVRYFEFDFVDSCLPRPLGSCLDLSSPRIFSLKTAAERQDGRVLMANPDAADAAATERLVRAGGIPRVTVQGQDLKALRATGERFDAIWSISVIEHIAGEYDDRDAVRWLFDMLNPGGRLIITLPVEKTHRDDYRKAEYYGTQPHDERGLTFFARFYDKRSLWERIPGALSREPDRVAWWGETTPGWYRRYEQDWVAMGLDHTVNDARLFADHFRRYDSWEAMPGVGICGLMFQKPAGGGTSGAGTASSPVLEPSR